LKQGAKKNHGTSEESQEKFLRGKEGLKRAVTNLSLKKSNCVGVKGEAFNVDQTAAVWGFADSKGLWRSPMMFRVITSEGT